MKNPKPKAYVLSEHTAAIAQPLSVENSTPYVRIFATGMCALIVSGPEGLRELKAAVDYALQGVDL